MATTLFLRDTTHNAVFGGSVTAGGVTYRDLLSTRGAASTTAVVNSTNGGTNIQLTKTAGGAVMQWVSGLVPAGGFTLAGLVTANIRGLESSMNNNVGLRIRLYQFTANDDEGQLGGSPWDDGTELGTTDAANNWTFTPSSVFFPEGSRLAVRLYITNVGSMAAGTNTITYDGPSSGAAGDSFITLTETVAFINNQLLLRLRDLSRTKNCLFHTQDFATVATDTAGWFPTNLTVTDNAAVAPDGTTTACQITSTTGIGTDQFLLQQGWNQPNGLEPQTYSCYFKQVSGAGWVSISGAGHYADFDIANGVAGSVSNSSQGGSSTITDMGNGWYRCAWSFGNWDLNGSQGGAIRLRIIQGDTIGTGAAIGTSVLLWGAQIEQGLTATSYWPNTYDRRHESSVGDGRGTLTFSFVQPSVAHQLNATLTGVGVLSADLQKRKFITATFGGVGAMSADLRKGAKDLAAIFGGVGSLTAALGQRMDMDASFAGAGSLSARLAQALDFDVVLSGTGSLSAILRQTIDFDAAFSGIGTFSATLAQRMDLHATLSGTGTLSADARKGAKDLAATFGGIGGLTVALRQNMDFDTTFGGIGALSGDLTLVSAPAGTAHDLAALFNGLGALSADLQKTKTLSATFQGAGALSADLDLAMALSAALSGVGALSADVRKAALSLSATFAGAGSLSATMRQNMDLDATLSGVGSLSADARKGAIQLSATLSGTGSLIAVLGQVLPLQATYSGVGGLSVPLAQNMALSTLFQGVGAMSASANVPGIVNNWDFQAQFTGSGTMSAALRQNMALAASYGGAGALTATLSQRFLVASVFAGAGSLSVDAQKAALQVSSTLSGAGSLSATVGQSHSLSAVLNGTGVLSADTRKSALQLTATFNGLGTLSADMQRLITLNASFAGQGSLSASIQQAMALQSSLAGVGALSASISRTVGVTASFAGTGTFSARITQQMLLSASLIGEGDIFADLTRVTPTGTIWSFPTQLDGIGTLGATLRQNMALQTTYGGVGVLTADMRKLLPLNATFSGIGALSAALRIERGLSATFGGVGTLSANVQVRAALAVAFTGTGTMLVTVAQRHRLDARFDGQGVLRADPFTHLAGAQPLAAAFAGEGTLTCNLLHVAHEVVPTYDYPIGRSLDSDYGKRRARRGGRLVIGRR